MSLPIAQTRTDRSVADVVVAVVLTVLYVLCLLMLSMAGLMLSMMSDSCGSAGECRTDRIVDGMGISTALIWVPFVAAVVLLIVRVVQRRTLWWIPLLAGLASVGIFVIGFLVAASGVPQG